MALVTTPTFDEEAALWSQGYRCIAGVDEVGRGPVAGPVVAAAVVLFPPEGELPWLKQVRDSKQLTARQRAGLEPCIRAEAFAVGVGVVSPMVIDRIGIAPACREAMRRALADLPCRPDFAVIDGRDRLTLEQPHKLVVKGDGSVLSVAAASIVAKVYRDALMIRLDACCSGWGFARHKGYATAEHLAAIQRLGPSVAHRRSFFPFRQPPLPLEDARP